ncbi:MAG: radical SAM protein [Acidobacteriota bacterium]|nr:radical SAM protein [Acidobacteriota bacterium]
MNISKIVLVQPNLRWVAWNFKTLWEIHPVNLCMLAAMIEDRYDITIIDANIDDLDTDEFKSRLARLQPDLVGITLLTMEYGETAHIAARLVKEVDRDIVTVLGGIYATQAPELAGKDTNIDYLVLGEGEYVFPALLEAIQGRGDMPDRGVGYRCDDNLILTGKAPFIQDLDALPLPAYHLVDYERYTRTLQRISVDSPRTLPYARILTSRGCPIGCTFCEIESISGKPFRSRSVEHVISEMKLLKENYGITSIIFDDDNLYVNRRRTKELCKAMVRENLNLKWNAIAVSVFYLNDEILEAMAASGCQYVDMAIESGVERVLKEIVKKPVKLDYARRMIDKAKSLGIDVNAHFIIGFPGETWDEIRATIRYAESLNADYIKFFIYQPLPETPLFKTVMEQGLLRGAEGDMKTGLNWSDSSIISDEFTPQDLRVLRAYEWDRINFSFPERRKKIAQMMRITEEELNKLRKDTLASVAMTTYPAHMNQQDKPKSLEKAAL